MTEDDLYRSKNHGQSIRYKKRVLQEREAKELYEDGIKQLEEDS